MIDGRRVLAVVPARGGSKGIKLKNLRPLKGRPLIAWVGDVVRALPELLDRAVVSTDHEAIAEAAVQGGIAAPFRRPAELSGDAVADWDVLHHALLETERLDAQRYDIVVMLQPTSPLRRPEHVRGCIEKLVREGWDAVWTVSPTDSKSHPLKQLLVQQDGRLDYYDPAGARIIARQQLKPVYHRNGVAYAITRACLLEQKSIMGARAAALVLDEPLISIDTEWDIALTEFLLDRRAGA